MDKLESKHCYLVVALGSKAHFQWLLVLGIPFLGVSPSLFCPVVPVRLVRPFRRVFFTCESSFLTYVHALLLVDGRASFFFRFIFFNLFSFLSFLSPHPLHFHMCLFVYFIFFFIKIRPRHFLGV